jgi:hypothetical protein
MIARRVEELVQCAGFLPSNLADIQASLVGFLSECVDKYSLLYTSHCCKSEAYQKLQFAKIGRFDLFATF